MPNSKRLYFIPIIARALESDHPRKAMREAFDRIYKLGKQPEYRLGFRQFQDFAQAALKSLVQRPQKGDEQTLDVVYPLVYDLATDTFEGREKQKETLLTALSSHPEWLAQYRSIKEEAQELLATKMLIEVEVLREEVVVGSFSVSATPAYLSSIIPGEYTVRLSNGRVLWQGEISSEDVIWAFAFPGKDLAMAAETEMPKQKPTRTLSLMAGELILDFFAGLESGSIGLRKAQRVQEE
ncbi:MAG: hypothetical protein SWH78_12790 [Thermodesulfobacteriota bacterium]|nr:hypothetical protein [Thermodesulfobacteriota bacterium]